MKYTKKILALLLVMFVAFGVGLVSCSPSPTEGDQGSGDGVQEEPVIKIIFDFDGTFLPEDYGVVPFIVGGLNSINSSIYYGWENVTNGGIKQDGTGSHVLKKIDAKKWYFLIKDSDNTLDPDTSTEIEFKAANYNPNGWNDVVNNFWNTVGAQTTGLDNEKIIISNKQVTAAYKPGDSYAVKPGESTNGITISADGRTVTIKVAEHGGWGIHLPYTVNNVSITLITSNVATNIGSNPIIGYGYVGTISSWNDNPSGNYIATILSTNNNGTVNISATFTYSGAAKIEYKVKGTNANGGWEWSTMNNVIAIIPQGVTHFTNYFGGPVNF